MSVTDRALGLAPLDLTLAGPVNELSDRMAMGLPPQLVERTELGLLSARRHLLRADPQDLVTLVEDPTVPFDDRLAAGRVLGLVGDLRCLPGAPQMVERAGGAAEIGLPLDDVARVHRTWRHLGVRREWIEKETPRHQVRLRPYRLSRYLVTNLEYAVFLRETGHTELPTSWPFGTFCWERANEPVWTVTESAAQKYAEWLSRSLGRRFRLPTEYEWETAAAGPEGLEFPWGPDWLPDRANTVEEGPLTTTPVGCYPAGRAACGAEDMAGNVEEWVADDYAPYPGGPTVRDDLAAHGSYRVARGGSFTRFADLARTRRRHGRYQRALYAIGFRLAEDVCDEDPLSAPVAPAVTARGDRSW